MPKNDSDPLEKRFERLTTENGTLRKSLIRKEGLLNALPSGLVVVMKGKILEANQKALDLLGYRTEEILGRDFLEMVHPGYKAHIRSLHRRRVEGKPVPNQYEADLVSKTGRSVSCEVAVEKILWDGRLAFLLRLTGLEVRKTRERELIRMEKRELIATMATGLRRSLASVAEGIAAPQGRTKGARDPEGRVLQDAVGRMQKARHRLEGLTGILESLSREGYERGRVTSFDLGSLVQEAISRTEANLRGKAAGNPGEIRFKTYLRPVPPVEGNPDELREVMVGLIDNAVAAMPQGGDLHISVEESAGNACIYVQDSGTGIPEEIAGRVMDPFFTTKGKDGNGLGLSLASAVLRRHQGEMDIESKAGKGTTISIRMPLGKGATQGRTRPGRRGVKNARILVVEEEDMIRELFAQVLSKKGYKVLAEEDALTGLERLKAGAFDLVLAGSLPGEVRGLNLVRRIRRIAPATRIALIGAEGTEAFPGKGSRDKVDLRIDKPIDMTLAVNRIGEILKG